MCECFIYKSIKLFYSKISCLRLCRKLVKEEDKKHICGLPKDSGNGTQYDTIRGLCILDFSRKTTNAALTDLQIVDVIK